MSKPIIQINGVSREMTEIEYQEWLELRPSDEEISQNVRVQRNSLLAATDWVVTRSYEKNEPVPEDYVEYRQLLRDVPQQEDFPHEIIWPSRPE